MKLVHIITLGLLALCLGCGSGESDKLPTEATQTERSDGRAAVETGTAGGETKGTEQTQKLELAAVDMAGKTAEALLDKMVDAYKNATSYTDTGQVQLSCTTPTQNGNQPVKQVTPMSMSMEKPNKFLISANKGTAICDGKTLYEYVDPLPHQLLQKPAPEKITIESIFTEPILADAMGQGPTQYYTWIPIQAILLLADKPLNTLLYNVSRTELLEPKAVENRMCYRVAAHRHDGKAVFWIDAKSFVLRRFEYPLAGIRKDFQNGQAVDLKVVANFRGAALNTKVTPRTFLLQPPEKVQIVKMLAPLQIHMLGRPAPEFFFNAVDGKPITLKSLAGKTVVIEFWASWSIQSRDSLQMTNKVAQQLQGDPRVVFLACSTDRATVNNEALSKMLRELHVSLPIYYDPQNFAKKKFLIPGVPVTVIIGPKGRIQEFQSNTGPRDGVMLERSIRAVVEGINIYDQQLSRFESIRVYYSQIIQRMLAEDLFIDPQSIMQMMPIPSVASQSSPKRSQLAQLWFRQNLGVTGNILVLNDSDPPRIFVCHDSRSIAELDTQGEVLKDYNFALPPGPDSAITNIRTGKTATGERFYVGFAPSCQQFFVLDKDFRVKWSFPASGNQGAPGGIADVQIVDLTGDGTPEICVAYRGAAGVKAVSLEGKVLWSNRETTGVTKMAVVPKSQNGPSLLLCTTDKSSLVGLDGQGKVVKKFDFGNRRFFWITAEPLGTSGETRLCGLSAPDIGKNEAFGISLSGDLLWTLQLPDGTTGTIINRITSLQADQWVLLGADSSLHIISDSGLPIDSFNYGSFVGGIATVKLGDRQVLLISSSKGVEAVTLQSN